MFPIKLFCVILIFTFIDLKLPPSILFSSSKLIVTAFNIDEKYPIIITNKFNGKNAHFGATVVLLPKPNGSNAKDKTDITGWVLIGAPKANSTNANHSQIYEPGLIWRCALGSLSSNAQRNPCEIVEMDPTGEYDPRDRNLPSLDRKDGGWLGGSMTIGKSDNFVACASRWINQKYSSDYLLNGICYWLPKSNLYAENTLDPPNWPWLPPKLSYRLSPLLNKTKQWYDPSKYANIQKQKTVSGRYDWSFGQFGFSIHTTSQNELIAGAVGILDWTGSVVYYRDTSDYRPNFHRYNAHVGYSSFSELVVVQAPKHRNYLESADYFGYSVTSGNFFLKSLYGNKTQFASGAPRSSSLSGKVLIFTINELPEGRSDGTLDVIVEPIEGKENTNGIHYGSYFGYSLVAVDTNNDGFVDLLVGAPLYGTTVRLKRNTMIEKSEDIQADQNPDQLSERMRSGDEGCVFLYLSNGKDFIRSPSVVCGDKVPGARFGTAITSLQDINSDGYNDIAIGAPYENEGHGAVYIYHGGANNLKFAQKLLPQTLSSKIRTFGWSLALGEDIDSNGYPDLAVGAYESNQVVIYRTIPIVHFTATLTASIPKLLASTDKFNLTSCISYSGHGEMHEVLGIWVKITIEAQGRRLMSLATDDELLLTSKNPETATFTPVPKIKSKKLLFFRRDTTVCYNFTAFRFGTIDGLISAVSIGKEYWMDGNKEKGASKPVQYLLHKSHRNSLPSPAVDFSASKSEFADFAKHTLPMPASNDVQKEKLVLPVGTMCDADGDPECVANLTITSYLIDHKSQRIYGDQDLFILGSTDTATLNVEIFNQRELASLPLNLSIHWSPNSPTVRRLPPSCLIVNDSILCNATRPIKELYKESFSIDLDMTRLYGHSGERTLYFHFECKTNSHLTQECKQNMSIQLGTQIHPQNFHLIGSKVDYSPVNTSIPTFGLSQAFEIGLDGISPVASVVTFFKIPKKVFIDGLWVELISLKSPIVAYDGDFVCNIVNGSFMDDKQTSIGTVARMVTMGVPTTIPSIFSTTPSNVMDLKDYKSNHDYVTDFVNDYEDDQPQTDDVTKILLGKLRRLKRSINSNIDQLMFSTSASPGILKLSCRDFENSIVQCQTVSCRFFDFTPKKKAVVEFKLRLYNKIASMLVNHENHLEDISTVLIMSEGTIRTMDVEGKIFGEQGNLSFTSVISIPPPKEIPAWIFIVSIAGGLLILIIFMLILKKCGFFRRSKREELLRQRALDLGLRGKQNLPGTSSTTRVRTSSSSRHRRPSNGSSTGRNLKRKISFLSSKEEDSPSPPVSFRNMQTPEASSSLYQIGSPTTIAKQREMPGAVDLNELRRLYSYIDQDELY